MPLVLKRLTGVAVAPGGGGHVIFEDAQRVGHRSCSGSAQCRSDVDEDGMIWAVLDVSVRMKLFMLEELPQLTGLQRRQQCRLMKHLNIWVRMLLTHLTNGQRPEVDADSISAFDSTRVTEAWVHSSAKKRQCHQQRGIADCIADSRAVKEVRLPGSCMNTRPIL